MRARKIKKICKSLAASQLLKKKFSIFLFTGIMFSWLLLVASTSLNIFKNLTIERKVLGISVSRTTPTSELLSPVATAAYSPSPTPTIVPTLTPIPTRIPTAIPKPSPTIPQTLPPKNPSQYNATKINDVTWRVSNVANDDKMAGAMDIFNALNSYRGSHGVPNLNWDTKLAEFAQGRAETFSKNGSLDSHVGFQTYMNTGGFDKSGFNSLGENSAYLSGPMNGDNIIKKIFGADSSHDGQQLDPSWTHAGIGVSGVAVNINFGKNKK